MIQRGFFQQNGLKKPPLYHALPHFNYKNSTLFFAFGLMDSGLLVYYLVINFDLFDPGN